MPQLCFLLAFCAFSRSRTNTPACRFGRLTHVGFQVQKPKPFQQQSYGQLTFIHFTSELEAAAALAARPRPHADGVALLLSYNNLADVTNPFSAAGATPRNAVSSTSADGPSRTARADQFSAPAAGSSVTAVGTHSSEQPPRAASFPRSGCHLAKYFREGVDESVLDAKVLRFLSNAGRPRQLGDVGTMLVAANVWESGGPPVGWMRPYFESKPHVFRLVLLVRAQRFHHRINHRIAWR
jgi:hypothetical protein